MKGSSFTLCIVGMIYVQSLITFVHVLCRYSRRSPLPSRTMVFGFVTKAEQVTITCTRNIEIPLWMEVWNRCMMRWLPAIVWDPHASKLSKRRQFLPSSAKERTLNNFMILRSNSLSSSAKFVLPQGSWRPHTRQLGQTLLFRIYTCGFLDKILNLLCKCSPHLFSGFRIILRLWCSIFDRLGKLR